MGPCRMAEEMNPRRFETLVDAIIYQQLAYKAARTISLRLQSLYARQRGAKGRLPQPQELLATPRSKLRAAGLSRQKIGYLRDLARKARNGTVRLAEAARMSDEALIENLTQVKGIGRWTAEMFLMFCLGRPDVLPVGDLGLQYGYRDAFGMKALPAERTMRRRAEAWRPYRSVATWYLWALRREKLGVKREPK